MILNIKLKDILQPALDLSPKAFYAFYTNGVEEFWIY